MRLREEYDKYGCACHQIILGVVSLFLHPLIFIFTSIDSIKIINGYKNSEST
jgi:hypothetical protein